MATDVDHIETEIIRVDRENECLVISRKQFRAAFPEVELQGIPDQIVFAHGRRPGQLEVDMDDMQRILVRLLNLFDQVELFWRRGARIELQHLKDLVSEEQVCPAEEKGKKRKELKEKFDDVFDRLGVSRPDGPGPNYRRPL